ncbi:ice-binding family protein [Edaphobacter paludis]|uniref:Ice-binding family protein n=1 Tax=Edaphobacter paludis TaxID=3035702 RepID=A0AAU7D2S9_9BACT
MQKHNSYKIWLVAFLLIFVTTGCKDLDKNPGTPGLNLPTVVSVSPSNGTTAACGLSVVNATFSEAMDPSTINGTTFTLAGPNGTAVSGQVSYNSTNKTATFTLSAPLAENTKYTATITTGAKDLYGNAVASNYVWSFTSGICIVIPPPVLPTVVTVGPINGSQTACISTVVTAAFNEQMKSSTINASTFTVMGPNNSSVTGTVTYNSSGNIATFTPSSSTPLVVGAQYTATITTGAQDAAGDALASDYVWNFTTSACTVPVVPTVVTVTPANGACPNTLVTGTFSEAMNPTTINSSTFTLAGAGAAGTVSYDLPSLTATYTPSAPLSLNTSYTATITTGAKDLSGNGLANDEVWTFTTSSVACQQAVPLNSAANFLVLAGSTVTNTGPTSLTGGNLGLSPGSAVTGFPPGTLTPPAAMFLTDPTAAQAQLDLTAAYNYAAGVQGAAVLPGDMTGLTFTPGVYKTSSTVQLSSGNVTLDAQGNQDAVFIFQVGSTLTTLGSTQVILAGKAQAKNVFWQVGSSATLGTNSAFSGTILSLQSITLDTGASLHGRALASNGAVTLDSNAVTAP